ncbi:hypothetical protein [Ilumatobacter sp.]|uniref:hypothetical protein n=1 Tax=Ilumatobacter sp. TaxID=1967498 RepID=UPI003C54D679
MGSRLNALDVVDQLMLLPRTATGTAIHLAAKATAADDFADHTGQIVERPEAPTCHQCLAVIDKAFPTPVPDSRVGVLADLAATAVNDHGTAEIVGVPGDQMNALRRAVRAELRRRFGFSTRTFTQDGLLVVSSPETRRHR